jgi:hypothetical protein
MRILARKMRLGRSPLAGDRRDGLGLSVARKRAPTGPSTAMSSLPTAPSSSIERCADQNPYARPWVGARLRATVAMASGSPSPASGLLPVPARQCHLCRQPEAHRSKDVHTNPCARPWVGARLRATAAIHGVRRYRLSQSRSGRAGRVAPLDKACGSQGRARSLVRRGAGGNLGQAPGHQRPLPQRQLPGR